MPVTSYKMMDHIGMYFYSIVLRWGEVGLFKVYSGPLRDRKQNLSDGGSPIKEPLGCQLTC